MKINYKKHENAVVVYIKGRLDVPNEHVFENQVNALLSEEPASHFIFNLNDVDYISSTGFGFFVSVMNTLLKRDKKFALCSINSSVSRIMDIVELSVLFHIFKDEKETFEFLKSYS